MAGLQSEKLHAACDECRTRKLKCSGEHPTCGRCEREKMKCIYSPQKQMGRPRKRRRENMLPEEAYDEQPDPHTSASGFAIQSPESGASHSMPKSIPTSGDLVAFESLPVNNTFSCATVPSTHMELPDQIDLYDAGHCIDSIDPLLWGSNTHGPTFQSHNTTTDDLSEPAPCSCLSLSYLSLSDLQSLNSFAFPAVVSRIRPALKAASSIVHCSKCPMDVFSAIQNIQSSNALITAIVERFHKVLAGIDAEATRLEQAGEKKPFRVGDNSPENMHLHTGRLDCPMGYDLELEPQDWRRLAKQMLRTEVLGGGHNSTPLIKIVEDLEARQRMWHADKSVRLEERIRLFGTENTYQNHDEDALCLRMAAQIRIMIDKMNWG